MRIARFEPWSYIDLMNRDFSHAMPDDSAKTWSPALDILEQRDSFLLRADLPGGARNSPTMEYQHGRFPSGGRG